MSTRLKQPDCPSCKMMRKEWTNLTNQLNIERQKRINAEREVKRLTNPVESVEETCDECGRTYSTCCCDELEDLP